MPDRRWSRRPVAALALTAGALTLAIASPAVSAQEAPPWDGSKFDAAVTETHKTSTFDISGVFVRSDGRTVADVAVSFDYATHPSADDPDCPIPPDPDVERVPSSTTTPPDTSTPSTTSTTTPPPPDSRYRFLAAGTKWVCNGTYTVLAEATAVSTNERTKQLTATLRVAVPPAPVPTMEATVEGGDKAPDPKTGATPDDPATVTVNWEQLADPDGDYPDFLGYRVQRAGPAEGSTFETVSDPIIDHDGEKVTRTFTDTIEAPGEYRYRVQSLRSGPDGDDSPVPSGSSTASVSVEIAGPPTTTTPTTAAGPPTTRRSLALPDVGRGTNNPRSPLAIPSAPTTIDTGFDEELDYGDLPEPGEELAGEGQSVIQTEGEGAGLLGPVAGAMVLLGWAGHVAYLNRLAKQF